MKKVWNSFDSKTKRLFVGQMDPGGSQAPTASMTMSSTNTSLPSTTTPIPRQVYSTATQIEDNTSYSNPNNDKHGPDPQPTYSVNATETSPNKTIGWDKMVVSKTDASVPSKAPKTKTSLPTSHPWAWQVQLCFLQMANTRCIVVLITSI